MTSTRGVLSGPWLPKKEIIQYPNKENIMCGVAECIAAIALGYSTYASYDGISSLATRGAFVSHIATLGLGYDGARRLVQSGEQAMKAFKADGRNRWQKLRKTQLKTQAFVFSGSAAGVLWACSIASFFWIPSAAAIAYTAVDMYKTCQRRRFNYDETEELVGSARGGAQFANLESAAARRLLMEQLASWGHPGVAYERQQGRALSLLEQELPSNRVMQMTIGGRMYLFNNFLSAYNACRFSDHASEFERMTASEAACYAQQLADGREPAQDVSPQTLNALVGGCIVANREFRELFVQPSVDSNAIAGSLNIPGLKEVLEPIHELIFKNPHLTSDRLLNQILRLQSGAV